MRLGPGKLPVLHVLPVGELRLPLLLPVGVDVGVGEDPVQPSLQVRARGELVKGRVRLGVGLLHDVLGVGRVARHPQRAGVELVKVLQGVSLETRVSLVGGLDVTGIAVWRACAGGMEPLGMLITYESSGEVRSIDCSSQPSTNRGM